MVYHIPALLNESIEGLKIRPEGTYVDVTFGGGGHSKEILKHLTTGRLIAFDQDEDAKPNIPADVININNATADVKYHLLNPLILSHSYFK